MKKVLLLVPVLIICALLLKPVFCFTPVDTQPEKVCSISCKLDKEEHPAYISISKVTQEFKKFTRKKKCKCIESPFIPIPFVRLTVFTSSEIHQATVIPTLAESDQHQPDGRAPPATC